MLNVKYNLKKLDNFIQPYKKWIIFLLVNFYYPFLEWLYCVINPTEYDSTPVETDTMTSVLTFVYNSAVPLYAIVSNLVVYFSYKVKYKNTFLINYNVFLLIVVSCWNIYFSKAYTKYTSPILITLLLLWFYVLFSLIMDLRNKPVKSKEKML